MSEEEKVQCEAALPALVGQFGSDFTVPAIITNLPLKSDDAAIVLTRIRTEPGKNLDSMLNTDVEVAAVAAYDYDFVGEDGVEIFKARNYVLIHPDESHTTFTSLQAWSNLVMTAGMLRDFGPWEPPLRFRVVSRPLQGSKRLHGLQYLGRSKAKKGR